jgi:hypothetical protein
MDRRTLLRRVGVVGLAGLAGCSGDAENDGRPQTPGGPTTGGSPTPEPSPTTTPVCGDETYTDDGEFSFEYGVVTHNDPDTYDGTLRIYHIRTPVCAVPEANPTPAFPGTTPTPTVAPGDCPDPTEALLAEREYRVTDDLSYDIVDAPVTGDIDTYRLEWTAAGGTDITFLVEEAARGFVDTDVKYEYLVCNPGARRFGFVVADGKPRIVRSPTANSG